MPSALIRAAARLVPFLTGASAGLLAGVLVARRRGGGGSGGGAPSPRAAREGRTIGEGWSSALEGAARGLAAARERLGLKPGEATEPDPGALAATLVDRPGAEGVRVRDLGGGIVEVYGTAPGADVVDGILRAVTEVPGVLVVVNRVWTPASRGRPAPSEAPPSGN